MSVSPSIHAPMEHATFALWPPMESGQARAGGGAQGAPRAGPGAPQEKSGAASHALPLHRFPPCPSRLA
jgi:hypothetical protein